MWWGYQLRAGQYRPYWRLVRLVQRARFQLRRQAFLGAERISSVNSSRAIFLALVRVTVPQLLLAMGTAAALLLSEVYFAAPRWSQLLPIPLSHLDDRDSYAAFLSTISGIGGVLIALYYTGMVAVGSAVYARAPGVLRNLLLREPVGKLYMQLVAYTTFVSLCLLAFYAMGFSPIRLAFPFLILLSGVTILSFVQLGQQAFHFFDPTSLSDALFTDLEKSVKQATVKSSFWNDGSFQAHAKQGAESALNGLLTLASYSTASKHLKSDAIAGVAISTIRFLYRYEAARSLIPTQSKWYPSEYKHPDFYVAGELKVEFALRLGTSIEPENVAQEDWIEEEALKLVLQALESNLTAKNESGIFRVLNYLQVYIGRLGELWEVDAALRLAARIGELLLPFAVLSESESAVPSKWQLGLAEYLGLLPTAVLLGFVKSLEEEPLARIHELLARIRWGKPATLYQSGVPRFALASLEWFQPRMAFEQWSEGNKVTPDWFIVQVIVSDHLKALQSAVDLLLGANKQLFEDWHSKSVAAKGSWAAAIVLNRQGEFIRKTVAHSEKFAAAEADYDKAKIMHDLRGWPTGKNTADERISQIERDHRIALAKAADSLVGHERPSHLPDYAGEFLSQTAQTLVLAIFRDDSDTFRSVFPLFFQASIKEMLFLLKTKEGDNDQDQFHRFAIATSPIVDLVEITGYAMLASELHQPGQPWNLSQETWRQYLTEADKTTMRIGIVNDTLTAADMPGIFAPGESVRSGWRTQAQDWMIRSVGLDPGSEWSAFAFGSRRTAVQHPSAIVRAFLRAAFPGSYRGIDVFAAAFFIDLPGAKPPGRGFSFNGFLDALRRELKRGQAGSAESGEDSDDWE